MKRVAISQSNYIPWKGYFDLIHSSDVFVFYDDVQFTKNDWRHRNRVKAPGGARWMSTPAGDSIHRQIRDVEFLESHWQKKHWKTLLQLYRKAPHFDRHRELLESVYLERNWTHLSALNQYLTRRIATECLGIKVEFLDSATLPRAADRVARILAILEVLDADRYVSGPSAQSYLTREALAVRGISLEWLDYSGYPEYPQFHPPFDHAVTILDLLFHTGPDAPWYIWGWRSSARPG